MRIPDVDDRAFWAATTFLHYIFTEAKARLTPPWAVLGATLARGALLIPHAIMLPAIVGTPAPINWVTALIGPSGAGKGLALGVARDIFVWPKPANVPTTPIGTGEGIVATYAHAGKTDDAGQTPLEWETHRALFTSMEIDMLRAQATRQGATVMSMMRAAWSGEDLGSAIADRTRRCILPAGSYRFSAVLGIQPGRSQWLVTGSEADGGTPQRFAMFMAGDPHPDPSTPSRKGRLVIDEAQWSDLTDSVFTDAGLIPVCSKARETIRDAYIARVAWGTQGLDGHALLTRLKTAAILAALEGNTEVTDLEWDLAGAISQHSALMQQVCLDALTEQQTQAADESAQRIERIERSKHDSGVERVRRSIVSALQRSGGHCTRTHLSRSVAGRDKKAGLLDDAIVSMEAEGIIRVQDSEDGPAWFLRPDLRDNQVDWNGQNSSV